MAKFDYNSVPGDYQYTALLKGPKFQKFWHIHKIQLVKDVFNIRKTDRVLDLGCGSGNVLMSISKQCKEAYGADVNKNALQFINKLATEKQLKNVKVRKVENKKLPFVDAFFDKIVMMELIEHLKYPSEILKECRRILKPGGQLLLTTPDYKSFWPVLELISDTFHLTPKIAGEQHLCIFNKAKLNRCLKRSNFKILRMGSMFFISPFMSLFSFSFARWLYKFEIQKNYSPGMLLYSVVQK